MNLPLLIPKHHSVLCEMTFVTVMLIIFFVFHFECFRNICHISVGGTLTFTKLIFWLLQVNYGGLTSIRSRYMEATAPVPKTQGPPAPKVIPRAPETAQKSPSVSPPRDPAVIRSTEPRDETEELPPQNITRGLVARFRQIETESGNQASPPAPGNAHAKVLVNALSNFTDLHVLF